MKHPIWSFVIVQNICICSTNSSYKARHIILHMFVTGGGGSKSYIYRTGHIYIYIFNARHIILYIYIYIYIFLYNTQPIDDP